MLYSRGTLALGTALLICSPVSVSQTESEILERSTSPSGVQVHDSSTAAKNANISHPNTQVSVDKVDKTQNQVPNKNTEPRTQGNTKIDATARHLNTVSSGEENTAANVVGSIGGR